MKSLSFFTPPDASDGVAKRHVFGSTVVVAQGGAHDIAGNLNI